MSSKQNMDDGGRELIFLRDELPDMLSSHKWSAVNTPTLQAILNGLCSLCMRACVCVHIITHKLII